MPPRILVPDDLMDPVIWSLQMFHRVLSECSDEQLYDAGHYLRHQQAESAGRFMVSLHARFSYANLYVCAENRLLRLRLQILASNFALIYCKSQPTMPLPCY